MSWFEVIKRVGKLKKIQMKFFRPAVLRAFKDVDRLDSNNLIKDYLDDVFDEYERLLRLEYAGMSNYPSIISQHVNKYRNSRRTNATIANVLRHNGWEGATRNNRTMIRKEYKILKRKRIDYDKFKEAVKIAGDKFSTDEKINFTAFGEDAKVFMKIARQAYAKLTGSGQHANKVFSWDARTGRLPLIKKILFNHGWDDESTNKEIILVKVI
tara:strand:- start:3881 stop:4516 length:636 start_codon:yes stop_codon:yes gene_type:complete